MDKQHEWPATLFEVVRYFSDPDVCLAFMVQMRWPDGVVTCPHCGRTDPRFLANARLWECRAKHPRKKFSIKVGTIFEDSPIGFDKWLPAVWLLTNAKNGISSYELGRSLGVTQKTAWFMLSRIRLAMQNGTFEKLGGEVEIDETFIGGEARNMHKGVRARKITGTGGAGTAAVLGLLERHGRVRIAVIPDRTRGTLQPRVRAAVEGGAEVFTDALSSYRALDAELVHQFVDHAAKYVDGKVHANGIENFWSLLRPALSGTYVSVEPFYLFHYLDEQSFRFNERHGDDRERLLKVIGATEGKRLTYKRLTGKPDLDTGKGAAGALA